MPFMSGSGRFIKTEMHTQLRFIRLGAEIRDFLSACMKWADNDGNLDYDMEAFGRIAMFDVEPVAPGTLYEWGQRLIDEGIFVKYAVRGHDYVRIPEMTIPHSPLYQQPPRGKDVVKWRNPTPENPDGVNIPVAMQVKENSIDEMHRSSHRAGPVGERGRGGGDGAVRDPEHRGRTSPGADRDEAEHPDRVGVDSQAHRAEKAQKPKPGTKKPVKVAQRRNESRLKPKVDTDWNRKTRERVEKVHEDRARWEAEQCEHGFEPKYCIHMYCPYSWKYNPQATQPKKTLRSLRK